jgi:hypothetical protein
MNGIVVIGNQVSTNVFEIHKYHQKHKRQPHKLLPFVGNSRQNMPQGIVFSLQDYCELVDTTGRIIRADKAGAMDSAHSPILSRLGLS